MNFFNRIAEKSFRRIIHLSQKQEYIFKTKSIQAQSELRILGFNNLTTAGYVLCINGFNISYKPPHLPQFLKILCKYYVT